MNGCLEGELTGNREYILDALKPANVFLCGAKKKRIVKLIVVVVMWFRRG